MIKSHVKKSNFDLFDVWQALKHAITNQLKELRHVRVSQQLRAPLDVSGVLFEAVRGWVSHHALRKVQEQRQLLQRPERAPCSQSFTSSQGLPCSHLLERLAEESKVLLLEHFHPHWHLKRDAVQPRPVLEPRRVQSQILRRPGQPKTSTRREPSAFELVEIRKRAPSKCSGCHAVGHAMTSKSCPLRFKDLVVQTASSSGPIPPLHTTPEPIPEMLPADVARDTSMSRQAALVEATVGLASEASQAVPEEIVTSSEDTRQSPPRYDSPQAVYQRYTAARSAWYAAQPAGALKTNQQYRRAMGLPLRYGKQSYEWCIGYKQMGRRAGMGASSREWTKDEMMAYLDWSQAEDARVEAQVAKEMGGDPLAIGRRGMEDIWRSAEQDSEEQQKLYSNVGSIEDCIIVDA